MNTVKIQGDSGKVIAHRGLSGIETENTNAAFVAAGNRSYYGIETDIRRTADGNFVISHDETLMRVSGENVTAEEKCLEELQSIVLLDKDGSRTRTDLRVSTLEEYLDICKKYEKHCVLELKSDFTQEEITRIVEIARGFDYLESITFISFVYSNLTKLRGICPDQSAQFLFGEVNEQTIARLVADRLDADVHYRALTKETIALLHKNGLKVNCWTVDDREVAEQLFDWGVDYITSNILE